MKEQEAEIPYHSRVEHIATGGVAKYPDIVKTSLDELAAEFDGICRRPGETRPHRRTRMAGVVNDIEALAEFRAHLMRFNHDLAENFATIQAHWRELGEIWRDDMYRLFGEALEEVTPGIATYLSATEGHEAHLAALIERLSGYLETGAGAGLGVGRPPGGGPQAGERAAA